MPRMMKNRSAAAQAARNMSYGPLFLWWVGSWIFKQESVSVLNGMCIGNASPPRNLKPGKRVDRTAYRLKGRFDRLRERGINVFDLPPRKRRSVEPHNREDCGRRQATFYLQEA